MKNKDGRKRTLDILTFSGILLAIAMMVFGIVLNEGVAEPVREDYLSYSYDPETGALTDEPEFDEDGYNKAMQTYLAAEKADIGMFNFNLLSGFAHLPSVAITVGGTFTALMIAYPLSVFGKFPTYLRIALLPNQYDPHEYIDQIVEYTKEARAKGLLSLEDKLADCKDSFMKSNLMLVVDGTDPEKVNKQLQLNMDRLDERHAVGRSFMDMGSAFAPGFGMIGTLIGLVNMLGSLDDPNSIGPAMAVALLTTLYGSLLANVIFSPIGNKLSVRHDEEYLCCELVSVGIEAIQAGENPKYVEEKLNMMLSEKQREAKAKGRGRGRSKAAE